MSSEKGEAREWFINLTWHQNGGSSCEKVYFASQSKSAWVNNGLAIGKAIHVIEKSAYDALKATMNVMEHNYKMLGEERDKLREEKARLRNMLNKFEYAHRSRGYPTWQEWEALIKEAREALKEGE
jgi:hypothetical protein